MQMRLTIILISFFYWVPLHGAENPIVVFQKEKAELIKLLENSDLSSASSICAAETKSGNSYLFAIGEVACADGGIDSINSAKAIAHSKAMRAISQFMKTEVSSEESLKEITTVKHTSTSEKNKSTERVRSSIIKIRSMAIISQANILKSEFKANELMYRTVLALRITDK